jgi:hypothetical protein
MKQSILIFGFLLHLVFAQKPVYVSLSGLVLDSASQKPLPYINVYNVRLGSMTSTDGKGVFSIVAKENDTTKLLFSSVHYKNKQVQVFKLNEPLQVYLAEENRELDEIAFEQLDRNTLIFKLINTPSFTDRGIANYVDVQKRDYPAKGSALQAIFNPFSFFYSIGSKKAQAARSIERSRRILNQDKTENGMSLPAQRYGESIIVGKLGKDTLAEPMQDNKDSLQSIKKSWKESQTETQKK